MSKESLGYKLRRLRLERKLPLRKVAAMLDIDTAILSKMERGERKLSREVVQKLSEIFDYDLQELLIQFLSEKVLYEIGNEPFAKEALLAAEDSLIYRTKPKAETRLSKEKIIQLFENYFSKQNLVSQAWLFGSFARGDEGLASDIDVVIYVPQDKKFTLFDLAEIQENLQNLIHRKVDVVMLNGLRPAIRSRIEKEKILIYET